MTSRNLGENIGLGCKIQKKNRSILTHKFEDIFTRRDGQNLLPLLIRPTPTHDNSLRVDLKISNFWFAHPISEVLFVA